MNISASIATESPVYKWIILVNVMITTFMAVLDATVVNTALPVIMGTLGASMNTAEWILTGYMLSLATILSTTGWLSNRFGYKDIFIIGLIIFTAGSFMCGNSTSIGELIFWRVIGGFGGGILMPVGMSIVTSVFPPNERSMALGLWSIATAASVSFGPMIGGYIVDNLNWNYIFYINVPIGVFSAIFTLIVQRRYKLDSKLKLDIPGLVTSSIFLPVFLYGLSRVNSSTNAMGWKDPVVMGCMWLSALSFLLFIVAELSSDYPLINIRLFKNRTFAFSNIVILIFALGMFGSTFLIPLYMQDTLGYSAFQTGLIFLPVGIIQAFVSPASTRIIKFVDARLVIIFGLILLSGSFLMNYRFSLQTTREFISHSMILRGAGMGILYPPLIAVAIREINAINMAQASSIVNIMRQIGGSIGVSFFTYTLAVRRTYHKQMYSESIDYVGTVYNQSVEKLSFFYSKVGSENHAEVIDRRKSYIIQWLDTEAYISGLNDDFLLGAIVTFLAIIPVIFISVKKKSNKVNNH